MDQVTLSTAAQVIISLVPIIGIGIGGVVLFFYILWKHHEVKLQIKTGTFIQKKFNLKFFSLLAGLILTGIGFILTLVFILVDGISYAMLGGLLPTIIGIALLVFYKIYPDFNDKDDQWYSFKEWRD